MLYGRDMGEITWLSQRCQEVLADSLPMEDEVEAGSCERSTPQLVPQRTVCLLASSASLSNMLSENAARPDGQSCGNGKSMN